MPLQQEIFRRQTQIMERLDAIEARFAGIELRSGEPATAETVAAIYMRAGKLIIADPEFIHLLGRTVTQNISSEALETAYMLATRRLMSDPTFQTQVNFAVDMTIKRLVTEIEKLMRHPALLNRKQAAKFLGMSEKHLSRITSGGTGPKFSGSGKNRRWEPLDLIFWQREQPSSNNEISPKKKRRR